MVRELEAIWVAFTELMSTSPSDETFDTFAECTVVSPALAVTVTLPLCAVRAACIVPLKDASPSLLSPNTVAVADSAAARSETEARRRTLEPVVARISPAEVLITTSPVGWMDTFAPVRSTFAVLPI
jgi:hypothetical protein